VKEKKTGKIVPRACPLYVTEDPEKIKELKLFEGKCPVPALLMKMELEKPVVGASVEHGKIIMVPCCEWYRRNKRLIYEGSGWVLEGGITDDYLDCPIFSEWYWKYSGITPSKKPIKQEKKKPDEPKPAVTGVKTMKT
jgi:hypothetical protein